MTIDLRYSTRGKGWNSDPIMHIVNPETQLTLCGKNTTDWYKIDFGVDMNNPFICEKCTAKNKA